LRVKLFPAMDLHLASDPIAARNTERRADELLNELFKTYFTGQPHQTHLGDVTFPKCELYFNQASVRPPLGDGQTDNRQSGTGPVPQIHTVLTHIKKTEQWFACGNLSDWLPGSESSPFSGIDYGATPDGYIEEAVAGKLARKIRGTAIQWRQSGDTLVEEAQVNGQWATVRSFPGATSLRWQKTSPTTFDEQILLDSQWTSVRQVLTVSLWDGSKKLVTADALFSVFVRVRNSAQLGNQSDMLCRSVADNVKELFDREEVRAALAGKGMRHARIIAGPTPLEGGGMHVRHLVIETKLRYYLPRLH
jgi:hypothetical protein